MMMRLGDGGGRRVGRRRIVTMRMRSEQGGDVIDVVREEANTGVFWDFSVYSFLGFQKCSNYVRKTHKFRDAKEKEKKSPTPSLLVKNIPQHINCTNLRLAQKSSKLNRPIIMLQFTLPSVYFHPPPSLLNPVPPPLHHSPIQPTHNLWLRNMNTLTNHKTPMQYKHANNGVKLPRCACSPYAER
jgi:hypothetical protein